MTQVFISYSSKDRAFVQRLTSELQIRLPQVEVFYDMLLPPGSSFADQLAAQLEKADVVIAVLSPDYLQSQWAQQELSFALERQLNNSARVLPIVVRPCTPPPGLSRLTWVDFTEDYEFALMRLIWGITGERPNAAKGIPPGELTQPLSKAQIEDLLHELRVANEQFKSRRTESSRFAPAGAIVGRKRRCFVVMPFGNKELEIIYEHFVKPVLETSCDLDCERGDDVFGSNVIMDDILKSIRSADVVLAELTGKNANVFYEVGICHAMNKPVLLMAQSVDDVPFDLRHRRVLLYEYSPLGAKFLERDVVKNMKALLDL